MIIKNKTKAYGLLASLLAAPIGIIFAAVFIIGFLVTCVRWLLSVTGLIGSVDFIGGVGYSILVAIVIVLVVSVVAAIQASSFFRHLRIR